MHVPNFWYQLEWRERDRARRDERRRDQAEVQADLDELRENLDQMATLNRALWEILRDELGVTDDRLSEQLEQIVARRIDSGPDDGRTCSSCGRKVPSVREHCLYCGV